MAHQLAGDAQKGVNAESSAALLTTSAVGSHPLRVLTDNHLDELQGAFDTFDKDKDGRITKDELGDVMTVLFKLEKQPSNAELGDMMAEIDRDKNGTIVRKKNLQPFTLSDLFF